MNLEENFDPEPLEIVPDTRTGKHIKQINKRTSKNKNSNKNKSKVCPSMAGLKGGYRSAAIWEISLIKFKEQNGDREKGKPLGIRD